MDHLRRAVTSVSNVNGSEAPTVRIHYSKWIVGLTESEQNIAIRCCWPVDCFLSRYFAYKELGVFILATAILKRGGITC